MKSSFLDALNCIDTKVTPSLEIEFVSLRYAKKRVCAKNIYARYFTPNHDISLRDGYVVLKTQKDEKSLNISELQPIKTGAHVSSDAHCVVELEEVKNGQISNKSIIDACERKNLIIKPKGEDIKQDELLVQKGKTIGAFDIANLAIQGIEKIAVYKMIKLAYIGVGDELVDISARIKKGEIFNSNAYTIAIRGESYGAKIGEITHVKDDFGALKKKIEDLRDCDGFITIGGMSKDDTVDEFLKSGFLEVAFKGVTLAPAGLSALSFYGKKPILHLPGLPMSALLGFEVLGVPIIRKLYGKALSKQHCINAKLSCDIAKKASDCIIPGVFKGSSFTPSIVQAGKMNVLNNCNGYILPNQENPLQKGGTVKFFPFIPWNI